MIPPLHGGSALGLEKPQTATLAPGELLDAGALARALRAAGTGQGPLAARQAGLAILKPEAEPP